MHPIYRAVFQSQYFVCYVVLKAVTENSSYDVNVWNIAPFFFMGVGGEKD